MKKIILNSEEDTITISELTGSQVDNIIVKDKLNCLAGVVVKDNIYGFRILLNDGSLSAINTNFKSLIEANTNYTFHLLD